MLSYIVHHALIKEFWQSSNVKMIQNISYPGRGDILVKPVFIWLPLMSLPVKIFLPVSQEVIFLSTKPFEFTSTLSWYNMISMQCLGMAHALWYAVNLYYLNMHLVLPFLILNLINFFAAVTNISHKLINRWILDH